MRDNVHNSIERGARRLRIAVIVALVIVLAIACSAAFGAATGAFAAAPFRIIGTGGGSGALDLLIAAVSCGLLAVGLWHLRSMLRRMESGELFTRATIADLRNFTLFLLLSASTSILLPALAAIASALSSGGPGMQLSLAFDGGDFFALLVGGLLFFLARLLTEAQRIAEDAAQIV